MLAQLDPRSVVMVCAALWLLCALALLSMRRGFPALTEGVAVWAGGAMVMFAGLAFIGQRERLPELWSSVLGNGLLWVGMAACVTGLRRFAGRPLPVVPLMVAGIAYVAATAWFVLLHPDYQMRLVVNAFFIMLVALVLLETAWSIHPRKPSSRLMAACHGAIAGVCLLRILAVLAGLDDTGGLFDKTPMQKIFLVAFGMGWLLANAAFMLMVNDRLHAALHRAATYDQLSGLFNRGAVIQTLAREVDRSSRHGTPLSIIMIDIDHFKQVNDKHGHAAGDRVIADFATRAVSQLRRTDVLGRYGGEEFLAVLPETALAMAAQVAERVRCGFAAAAGNSFPCTVSIGVAQFAKGMTVDQLVAAADQALYRAKQSGRDRVVLAQHETAMPTPAENLVTAR